MTIVLGLNSQRKSQEVYPLASYCRDSYFSYKEAIQTIVNSSIDYEDIEMVEFPIQEVGPENEPLSIIAVKRQYGSPIHVIIRFSGTHGIEGYIGAAGQFYEIESTFHVPHNTLIIEIFGYNVWGFCHLRRSSSKNYDYNFTHSSKSSSDLNDQYHDTTLSKPKSKKRSFSFPTLKRTKSRGSIEKKVFKELMSKGQSKNKKGAFYNGGHTLDDGAEELFSWLEGQLRMARTIACIDIHSEPGSWGHQDVKIFDYETIHTQNELRTFFGNKIELISGEDAKNGDVCSKVFEIAKKVNLSSKMIGIRQTIETYPITKVMQVIFDENSAHMELIKYEKVLPLDHEYKKQLLECFYPSNNQWRHMAVSRLHELFKVGMSYIQTG